MTIEAPLRRALGIQPGWRTFQRIENGALVIRFLPPKHCRSLAGALRKYTAVTIANDDDLDRAIDESWTMPDPVPGSSDV